MLTERRTHRLCLNAEADGPAKCPAVAVQASDVAWECIPLLPPAGFTRENADAIVAKLDAMARPTMIQYAALFPVPCSHAFPQHLQGFPPWRAAGRERTVTPTLQTLQDTILLLPWLCFRGASAANPAPVRSLVGEGKGTLESPSLSNSHPPCGYQVLHCHARQCGAGALPRHQAGLRPCGCHAAGHTPQPQVQGCARSYRAVDWIGAAENDRLPANDGHQRLLHIHVPARRPLHQGGSAD